MATLAIPQQYGAAQFQFLGSNDLDARRRQLLNNQKRRNDQVQNAVTATLSRKDKVEFGEDILSAMFESEVNTVPDVASIDIQTEIEWYMRPYLLDFLVEAHAAFSLTPETLFLTLNILDRYCSKRVVYRKHYQLVGCTALLIAAKYEEISKQVPHVKELTGMCCGLYDEDMFVQMERHVLMTLEWNIGATTAPSFVRSALNDGPYDNELGNLALYICEIAIYHREFISLRASDLAKAAITLALGILGRQNFLGPCHWSVQQDHGIVISLSNYLATRSEILHQKYKLPQFAYVALLVDNFVARQKAMASINLRVLPISPDSSPAHPSISYTPRKRGYPFDQEFPLTPPITPGPAGTFNKDFVLPQVLVTSADHEMAYNSFSTMANAP